MSEFLGKKVRDIVTGFEGIAVCESKFLNGCIRISISAPLDKDGKPQDERWFDVQQVKVVGAGVDYLVTPPLTAQRATGGPTSSAPPKGMLS